MSMMDDDGGRLSPEAARQARNRGAVMAIGLTAVLALCIASFMPEPLIAATLAKLLFFGAIGACIGGLVRRDGLWRDHLTGWDQAAVLLLSSVVIGWTIDDVAVRDFLARQGGG